MEMISNYIDHYSSQEQQPLKETWNHVWSHYNKHHASSLLPVGWSWKNSEFQRITNVNKWYLEVHGLAGNIISSASYSNQTYLRCNIPIVNVIMGLILQNFLIKGNFIDSTRIYMLTNKLILSVIVINISANFTNN